MRYFFSITPAISLCLLLLLQGCVTVPLADPNSPAASKSMSFAPASNKATVYLYRSVNSDYGATAIPVTFNGGHDVNTAANTFTRIDVAPGTYKLQAHLYEMTADENELKLDLKANSVTFVELTLTSRLAWGGKAILKIVPKKDAVQLITFKKWVPQQGVMF